MVGMPTHTSDAGAPEPPEPPEPPKRRSLASISPSDLARIASIITRSEITEDMIKRDIAAGAPVRPDGNLHVMFYLAWLIREDTDDRRRHGRRRKP